MKTRVLYIVPTLMTGGLERMVYLLASRLDPERYAPEILCFDLTGPYEQISKDAGIPVTIENRAPGFLDVRFVRRLAARLKDDPVDLVHAHNATALVYAAFAARIAGKVPLVYTEHDRSFPGPVQDRAMHFAAGRLADKVVCVAEWLRRALVRHEGFDRARLEVVPNGIEADRFTAPVDVAALRAELDVPMDAPLASCVARLVTVKNHPMLLKSWRRVVDVWKDATLLLVGYGSEEAQVRACAESLGLGRSVRFLGDRTDVPRLLAASDFHVLSSKSEGMSLTLLETMAAGKTSVATAVGGNPEVLENGRTGLLVDSGDVHAMASAIGALIQDPARAKRMGAEARAVFGTRFTLEAMVDSYDRIYGETLAGRGLAAEHEAQRFAPHGIA